MPMTAASFLSLLLLAPAIDGWLGIYLDNERTEAVIVEVIPDSPAAKAGLRAGDVLLAVGDQATATREAFVAAIRAAKPGHALAIKVRRDGQEQSVPVALGNRPEPVPPPAGQPGQASRSERPAPAAESAPPSPVGRGYLGLSVSEGEDGVLIDRVLPDGPAASAKVQAGDRILKVGDKGIRSLADLDAAMQGCGPGKQVVFQLLGDSGERTVSVRLGTRPADGVASGTQPAITVAPVAPVAAVAPTAGAKVGQQADVETELAALRKELAEMRKQLEELRRSLRRE